MEIRDSTWQGRLILRPRDLHTAGPIPADQLGVGIGQTVAKVVGLAFGVLVVGGAGYWAYTKVR